MTKFDWLVLAVMLVSCRRGLTLTITMFVKWIRRM